MNETPPALCFAFPACSGKVAFSDERPLFKITVETPEGQITLTPADFPVPQMSRNGSHTTLIYQIENPATLEVTVELEATDREMTGTLSLNFQGDGRVRRVRFPHREWTKVEPFDRLLMPNAWGDDVAQPTRASPSSVGATGARRPSPL